MADVLNRSRAWFIVLVACTLAALALTFSGITPPIGSSTASAGMNCVNNHHHHFDGQYTIHHWVYKTEPAGPNQVKKYWKKARHKGNDFSNHTNASFLGTKVC